MIEKYIDLHVHTTKSDGDLTPTEIVRLAKEKNLQAIAITDHDCVDGIEEAIDAGRKYSVEIIPGIELSMQYANRMIHVLGLDINYKHVGLTNLLKQIQHDRRQRAKEIIRQLNIRHPDKKNVSTINEKECITEIDGCIGRMHIAKAMVRQGHVPDIDTAFDEYLHNLDLPKLAFNYMTSLSLLTQAEAIPILAHATRSTYSLNAISEMPFEQMKILVELKKHGLIGIDCPEGTELEGLSKTLELIITSASDFHGLSQRKKADLGCYCTPYSLLITLRKAKQNWIKNKK